MDERFRAEVSPVERAGRTRYSFRGVASTVGNVDRMRRVFLPGAFGAVRRKVPLLLNHDETQVIGASTLIPKGGTLLHESSLNPKASRSDEVQSLLEEGDIMSTSISWISDDRYHGFADLRRAKPELARELAGLGLPQREDVVYFASAQILENSVVPIPANELALIGAASLVSEAERGFIDSMREVAALAAAKPVVVREIAAGARNSQSDQALIQSAHDALSSLGATCTVTTDNSEGFVDAGDENARSEDPDDQAHPEGYAPQQIPLGGWSEHMHSSLEGQEEAAAWSSAQINDLPDSSFLYIEDGGSKDGEGKTAPRELRHFPYRDAGGKVDLPHLRNALARIPQSSVSDAAKATALAKAKRIAKENGIDVSDDTSQSSLPLPSELEQLDRELAELAGRFAA